MNDTRTEEWELLCRLPLAHGNTKEKKGRDWVGNAATAGDVPALLAQTPSVRQQHQTWSKLLQGIGGPQAVGVLAARLASVRLFLLGRASRRQGCESQQLSLTAAITAAIFHIADTRRLSLLWLARMSSCARSASAGLWQCAGALCVLCTVTVIASSMKHLSAVPMAHAHELTCALCVCSVAGQPAGFLVGVRTMTIVVSATRPPSLLWHTRMSSCALSASAAL